MSRTAMFVLCLLASPAGAHDWYPWTCCAGPMLKGRASQDSKRLFAEWAAAAKRADYAAGSIYADAVCQTMAEADPARRAAWRCVVHALELVMQS